jgi:hypothetical protein
MTNNSLVLSTFNTQFTECLDDISTVYVDDVKFKKYKRYVDSVKKMNPSLLIKGWKVHITDKYASKIEEGDITYFLNKDYKDDLSILEKEKPQLIDEIINDIRIMIGNMTSDNKTRSFQYIQNLTKLSKHYV